MKKVSNWVLSGFIAVIFVQSMFFKFSGATETVIIFSTIGDWLGAVGFPEVIAQSFRQYGAYAVGAAELLAAGLILVPATRVVGASLSFTVISGALFFHLFTPLGVDRIVDLAGNTDGGALFFTAVAVWVSSLLVLVLSRRDGGERQKFDANPAQPLASAI